MITDMSAETRTPPITVKIQLSEHILTEYEAEAAHRMIPVSDVIIERLTKYATVPSEKPLVLSDTQRRLIETSLKKNLNTTDELVLEVSKLASIHVAGVEVRLGSKLAERLASRSIGMDLNAFVESTTRRLLEEFCGLR